MSGSNEQDSVPEIQTAPSLGVDNNMEAARNAKDDLKIETASVEEGEKGYYSKLSVWLMVLFSGLAIGSDG